jgi:hypothetical protein
MLQLILEAKNHSYMHPYLQVYKHTPIFLPLRVSDFLFHAIVCGPL